MIVKSKTRPNNAELLHAHRNAVIITNFVSKTSCTHSGIQPCIDYGWPFWSLGIQDSLISNSKTSY